MNCEQTKQLIREQLLTGGSLPVEAARHLHACPACAREMAEFTTTMALLDEWQAPEPSPYFDTRLQARLREERFAAARPGSFGWFRTHWRPAFVGAALALCLALGVGVYQQQQQVNVVNKATTVSAAPGSPVGDLQALDKNQDLYSSDIFDEDSEQGVNP